MHLLLLQLCRCSGSNCRGNKPSLGQNCMALGLPDHVGVKTWSLLYWGKHCLPCLSTTSVAWTKLNVPCICTLCRQSFSVYPLPGTFSDIGDYFPAIKPTVCRTQHRRRPSIPSFHPPVPGIQSAIPVGRKQGQH